jgi:Ca-activated chloride channel family protein
VGIVEREWVTPEHREAAEAYITFLLARPQQETALRFGFRPSDVEIPLGAPFDAAHGVDAKEPQTTLEVPPVEVIEAVRELWRAHKKRSDITLVLDISGSMREDGKMDNAKAGAEQLLQLLDPEDTYSFLPFNAEAAWAEQGLRMGDARAAAVERVHGLFANGGTALYDALSMANAWAAPRSGKGRISAIVVLSDGEDSDSRTQLAGLLQELRGNGETQRVRVFTIAYGRNAQKNVLEQIAEATHGRSYVGTPENIRTVFREISTFF